MHLTARLAWHDNGWNGTICRQPECNTYCVGSQSFPGDVIARQRDTRREMANAGRPVASLRGADLPPCVYSVNAFGGDTITGFSNPPGWMRGGATRTEWDIPPTTVCVWPYEEVYSDAVKNNQGRYDNDARAKKVEEFIADIETDTSLIFYYANYSNPFSEDEHRRYVLLGVSRVREVGPLLRYADTTEYVRRRYAGGMIWARNVTSHYPEQGLRLPYHRYRKNAETLARLVVFPENPRVCKYGARRITDDDAIGLLEQFLNAVEELRRIGDDSENWDQRKVWILGCITDLWRRRGLYPGLPNILRLLGATDAVKPVIESINAGNAQQAHEEVFAALDEGRETPRIGLADRALERASRQWRLRTDAERGLLTSLLPRLDLDLDQMKRIASTDSRLRETHGLAFPVDAPLHNPYLICESYLGDNPDDRIPWPTVDRGVLPSPELGGTPYSDMEIDDARRLRALCVDEIGREPNHTFQASNRVLERVNQRLETLPEWKSTTFTERYFDVDRKVLDEALVFRAHPKVDEVDGNVHRWLYLRSVHEDEREVESALAKLAGRPDICLARPFTEEQWKDNILDPKSDLLAQARERYIGAVEGQAAACYTIFRRPLAVVTGAAGTGKTTVICAIILAVRATEGEGASITVMAPTGKASDRLRTKLQQREIERVETSTVHSYLAKEGWLNDNLTYRRRGGGRHGQGTIIVDEASMLDLDLMATFVRAIDWRAVRRLVLVGDPNQLPPIGRGRVFADTIEWLSNKSSPCVAELEHNLRQLENEVAGNGTAILRLANLFITQSAGSNGDATTPEAEELLTRVHRGGGVDTDLRVVYWHDTQLLAAQLLETIEAEMVSHTDEAQDPEKPYKLWRAATKWRPDSYQILTPHRGELHGVEALNSAVQDRVSAAAVRAYGTLSGITLYDKVIQVRNRSRSNPIWAYNRNTKRREPIEIYNGQIGFVSRHGGDPKKGRYNLRRFSVRFAYKENWIVDYEGAGEVEENLELAYAVSIHKAQGSEFDHIYIIVPKNHGRTLSSELLYTALTRATKHCTLLIEQSAATLLSARRPENSQIKQVNSSLFEGMFHAVPDALLRRSDWYAEGRIHETLTGDMVRSKSELVIANLLAERGISFEYEMPLVAPDGTMYLPDFSIVHQGERWFWEHWGMMSDEAYRNHREVKRAWYDEHFGGRLIETFESPTLSRDAVRIVDEKFSE